MGGVFYTTPNGSQFFDPIPSAENLYSRLIFIPKITLATYTALESYTTDMPFNIKTNNTFQCDDTFNFIISNLSN